MHNFPVEPTPKTLSFFIIFMSHHISPRSVQTYLSGVVNQLHPFFPDIVNACSSQLVKKTLQGCLKMRSKPTVQKQVLTLGDLSRLLSSSTDSPNHDDLLFNSIILTAFFALHRLGELVFPDDVSMQDWRKIVHRSSIMLHPDHYSFTLPAHKADRQFEGSRVIVWGEQFNFPTLKHFNAYLESRDNRFPLASPLWLTASGAVPTRSFVISHLCSLFLPSIAGQSLRAGGATMLAEKGAVPYIIQAARRWSSDAFHIYVR